jgi:hypothetical protein
MYRRYRARDLRALALVTIALAGRPSWAGPPATGPLKKSEANPRYFADASAKPALLVGSHNWHNFQDNRHRLPESQDPRPNLDYDAYLDLLEEHDHRFFCLWRWEAPKWTDAQPQGIVRFCRPYPWKGTGPGLAADGKRKFDLTAFDPEYFDRMRKRIIKARDRGIYVSVMLIEGWDLQFTVAWTYHPFHGQNNVNDIDADPHGRARDIRRRAARRDDRQGRTGPADRGRWPSGAHHAVPGAGGRPCQASRLVMIVAGCDGDARTRT